MPTMGFNIAYEMVQFLSNGETFSNYQRPSGFVDDTNFSESTFLKEEALKRHALLTTIFDDEPALKEIMVPFRHLESDQSLVK